VVTDATLPNPNTFWIGLNNMDATLPFTSIGDSTAQFTEWIATTEPDPTDGCVAYVQLTTADNIKMDSNDCLDPDLKFRYICEVSDECTALFMSRYPTQQNNHSGGLSLGIGG
jgi:hypothetical protein